MLNNDCSIKEAMVDGTDQPNDTAISIPAETALPPINSNDGVTIAVNISAHGVPAIPPAKQPEGSQDVFPEIERERWSATLCGVCDICVPNCCMSCFCPCVSLAQIYARVGLAPYSKALLAFLALNLGTIIPYGIGVSIQVDQMQQYVQQKQANEPTQADSNLTAQKQICDIVEAVFAILFMIAIMHARGRIRRYYQIPGSCCEDCLISCCCSCCAIGQMATHVKSYTAGSCSFAPLSTLPATPTPTSDVATIIVNIPTTDALPPVAKNPDRQQEVFPEIERERWAATLCGVCDNCIPNCCMSCFCPCVSLAQIYSRVGMAPYSKALLVFFVIILGVVIPRAIGLSFEVTQALQKVQNTQDPSVYVDPSLAGKKKICDIVEIVFSIIFMIAVMHARGRIRTLYQIPGSCCEDCLISCCCSCCAIGQMATHVKSYNIGSCSFAPLSTLPGYDNSVA
ncbi:TPA: hypothetical protein N0F65_010095 [Lagenidium giganteum]|uniref:PLAC8 family protein n=1 Tax=Lagenidium giganteum TaxID=4803 RepID=A0AAV2YKL2_9STRA|nr:TPA: hypothetical protein N0F65_010095 [Lagenidium giganteum]